MDTLETLHEQRSYRESYPNRVDAAAQTILWLHHEAQKASQNVTMSRREVRESDQSERASEPGASHPAHHHTCTT